MPYPPQRTHNKENTRINTSLAFPRQKKKEWSCFRGSAPCVLRAARWIVFERQVAALLFLKKKAGFEAPNNKELYNQV